MGKIIDSLSDACAMLRLYIGRVVNTVKKNNFPPKNENDFREFVLWSRGMKYDTKAVELRIKHTRNRGYIYVWRYKDGHKFLCFEIKDKWKPIWRWEIYNGRLGNERGYDPTKKANWYPVFIFYEDIEKAENAILSINTFKDLCEHFGLEKNYLAAEEDGKRHFDYVNKRENTLKKYGV